MLRERIAPALRELGFNGSGQVYYLPDAHSWALLGFQKSKYSNAREVAFTINLSAGSKIEWAEARIGREHWMPERPTANTRYGRPLWEARIGRLLSDGQDKWWRLSADGDTAKLDDEVVLTTRDVALPALREHVRPANT